MYTYVVNVQKGYVYGFFVILFSGSKYYRIIIDGIVSKALYRKGFG